MKKIFATLAITMSAATMCAETPLWIRDVRISPDGSQIAFTYRGDIYTVPAAGGTATRLTTQPSYEAEPVWSPDGSKIAFSSDRNGSMDIYIMEADGGPATRLTSRSGNEVPESFTPDGKYVMFSAAIQDPVNSAMFPSGRLTELYKVPAAGGRIEQILGTPAQMVSPSADGSFFLYQDQKGMENEWRKHHTSSVTRDIWRYDAATGKHTNLTDHAGEDRNPVLSADGTSFLFLSERDGGSMNVYRMPVDGGAAPKALTSFKEHPVRFLSQARNGVIALTWDGEIYTMAPGKKPTKVVIDIVRDDYNPIEYRSVTSGASGAMPSPDGKQVAFTYRGEVFVTSVDYKTTKQITHTPAAEYGLTWGADNRSLYYTTERNGVPTIYKASIVRDEDLNFPNATSIKEEPMFTAKDGLERSGADISPDGKKMAFVLDRTRLMVMDLDSKKVHQLTDGSENAQRSGVAFAWSPDSRWIAFNMVRNFHSPYYNVGLVNVNGTPEILELTQSGYFNEAVRWTPDGSAILFISDRYGMRSHASWGSLSDVMAIFVNKEKYDEFMLGKEDRELLKEAKKKADKKENPEKDDDKKADKKDKKSKTEEAADSSKFIKVDRDGFADRIVRLTPYSSDISDAIVDPDFETLYYTSSVESGYDLWKVDLIEGGASIVNKLDADGSIRFQADKSGKNIFLSGAGMLKTMPASSAKLKNVNYSSRMKLDRAAEREYMFDKVKNLEREKFYVKDMHGVDWERLTEHYRRFLPHITNNHDFSEMLSELLGELNVSHTGSGYRAGGALETTANLGLLYDLDHKGDGLMVAEVVKGGPFDRTASAVKAGHVIEAINNEPINEATDYTALFNGLTGKKTLVTIRDPQTGKTFDEVVRPISSGAMNELLYKRWIRQRADEVERLSGGRLGYVHIRSMGDDSFRDLYSDVLGKYNTCEGIVIDTRWNGGGRLHEDIEVMFSGNKYFTQEVRGNVIGEMPSRRWNKPSIMIQGEANYSNAHGTPWVFKHCGLGKLVGMPVPGTMTSVNWVTLQDPSLYFGIPVTGYRDPDGRFLENQQLEPDIKVANDPATVVNGEDAQLRTAVEELLREIDAKRQKK